MENSSHLPKLEAVLRRINETMDDFASKPAATVNDQGAFDDYPLHKVAIWGDLEAAKVLLDSGANINAIGEDGDTPLHRAVAGQQLQMAHLLLSRGADAEICNRYGIPAGVGIRKQ